MSFWILAAALALAVAALLARAARQAAPPPADATAFDIGVYRDQLAEVDRDVARGVIGEGEAERIRTEIKRRILAADTQRVGADGGAQRRGSLVGTLMMGAVVVGGGLGLYGWLGAPGVPDQGLAARKAQAAERRETRPSQAEAEAEMPTRPAAEIDPQYAELMDQLRATVVARPGEVQGLELLARNEANLGNFAAAYAAQEQLIAARGDDATAQDYADLAELKILAAGGYVSPEAEEALRQALLRDNRNGIAQYYSGLMMAQIGRPDVGFRLWSGLLRASQPDDAWVPPIRGQIEGLAELAGVRYTLPPLEDSTAPGPSQADIEAAGDMTDAERQDMIRGMVARLSDRLANEGGSPEEWARLIGAYGVLGETERARAIWEEARLVFGQNPEAMALITEAGRSAGVAE